MICHNCGISQPEDRQLCEKCGAPLVQGRLTGRWAGLASAAALDPALESGLKPALAAKLAEWSAPLEKAVCSVHILGKNYPLATLDALRSLLKDGWIHPDTPVLHQGQGRWFEAGSFPGLERGSASDPAPTRSLDKQGRRRAQEAGASENTEARSVLAARLGREAEEAAAAGDIARAIEIYEEVLGINPRYPLVKRRLKELRAALEHPPAASVHRDGASGADEERTTALSVEDLIEDEALLLPSKGKAAHSRKASGASTVLPPIPPPPKRPAPPEESMESTLQETAVEAVLAESTESEQSLVAQAPAAMMSFDEENTAQELIFEDTPHEQVSPSEPALSDGIEQSIEHTLDVLLSGPAASAAKAPESLLDALTFVEHTDEVDWSEVALLFERAGVAPRKPEALEAVFCASQHVCFLYFHAELVGVARALSDGQVCACICDLVVSPRFPQQLISTAVVGAMLQQLPLPSIILVGAGRHKQALRSLGFLPHQELLLRLGLEP